MNTPDKNEQENKDSSEKDSKTDQTGQQGNVKKPVRRGDTFGASGTEKRG
jgi:hypothetical protein